jgi:flagellar hook protein FlgE
MSFNIGLSGLRAATKDLNVTGNNIANAGTAGFKQSRAEFADVYAASVLGSGSNPQGSGVLLGDISQQFNQGNINYTQNALDLAINGNGFFVTSNGGDIGYTRAGYFGTDRDGYIVNNFGYAYLRHENADAAEPLLMLALVLDPGRANAWANLGQSLAMRGNTDAATAALMLAFQFSRDRGATYRFLESLSGDDDPGISAAARQTLQLDFLQTER